MATSAATINAPGKLPEAKPIDGFLALSLVAVLAVCVRAIWFTPVDAMLGAAQKIFYMHVPAAIMGLYVACGLLAISSILYLWLKDDRLDRLAEASAEVGLLFMGIVLATGPVWARTSWGTWWVWKRVSPARCFSGCSCLATSCCAVRWKAPKIARVFLR